MHLFTILSFIFVRFSSNIKLLRPGTFFAIILLKRLLERDTISKFAAVYPGPVLKLKNFAWEDAFAASTKASGMRLKFSEHFA